MTRRIAPVRLLNLLLLAGLLAWSIAVWPSLPARLPIHVDLDGTVDRWAERSIVAWFALPVLAAGVSLLLMGVRRLARRRPMIANLPDRDRLLRLPPAAQQAVLAEVGRLLDLVAVQTSLVFVLLQAGLHRVATAAGGPGWIVAALAVAVGGMPVLMIAGSLRLNRRLREESATAKG
ncbi:MAG TPA: DUF1648 domain-containing protein [Gemmatimonadales bacterium]|nr:DUF1648 domain-containing protein [Gemmatimonadales bacterium]